MDTEQDSVRPVESGHQGRSSTGSHQRHPSQADSLSSTWTGDESTQLDITAEFPSPPSPHILPVLTASPHYIHSSSRQSDLSEGSYAHSSIPSTPVSATTVIANRPAPPPSSSKRASHEKLLSFIQEMMESSAHPPQEHRISTSHPPTSFQKSQLSIKAPTPLVLSRRGSSAIPSPSSGTFRPAYPQSTQSHDTARLSVESGSHAEHALVHMASRSYAATATVVGLSSATQTRAGHVAQAVYTNPHHWRPLSTAVQEGLNDDLLQLPSYPESVRTSFEHLPDLPKFQDPHFPGPQSLPSTPGAIYSPSPLLRTPDIQRHPSRSSRRSRVSSIISRISQSSKGKKGDSRGFGWFNKSLPPLPSHHQHLPAMHGELYRDVKYMDDSIPLPDLADRADKLSNLLARGKLAHYSGCSTQMPGYVHEKALARNRSIGSALTDRTKRVTVSFNDNSGSFTRLDASKRHRNAQYAKWPSCSAFLTPRRRIALTIALVLITIGILLSVILTQRIQAPNTHHTCPAGQAGVLCDLDAICSCTTTASGRCDSVAQSLVTLVPIANRLFNATITPNQLSLVLWDLQGDPVGDCVSQAELVDVGPALTLSNSPTRTQWARAALLYSLFKSQDLNATDTMRVFVSANNFTSIANGAPPAKSPQFTILASGFLYDFASMTMSAPPASFKDDGLPSPDQFSRVGLVSQNALDRMYSFATASSTQGAGALSRYWTSVMRLGQNDLTRLITAMRTAPMMLPVNINYSKAGQSLSAQLPTAGDSFPPPVACYPGLSSEGIQRINAVESDVYGLPLVRASQTFNATCFPERPTYGILNLLRLRLPYHDSRVGMRMQGILLDSDVAPRVVLRAGEVLNSLPFDGGRPTTSVDSNPVEYGTVTQMDHVILNWLQSFPSVTLATQVVKFIVSASTTTSPAPANDTLFGDPNALASVPRIEIAVFGNIFPSDFSMSVSPFSNADNSLFFGSTQALAFRKWTLSQSSSTIAWTESASAPSVVKEHQAANSSFDLVWDTASGLIQKAASAGILTGQTEFGQIISTFQQLGAFEQ